MSLRITLAAALVSLSFACGARSQLDGLDPAEDGGGGSGGSKKQPLSCKEQGITYIYVVMDTKSIFAFNPRTGTFSSRGLLNCPDSNTAFSMAVNRKGIAFVELGEFAGANEGHIYQVNIKDGTCEPTAYVPDPSFQGFGMGFVANTDDDGETLFLASDTGDLATLEATTFQRSLIGPFSSPLGKAELTGTGEGRLFAFGKPDAGANHFAEVDPTSADVITDKDLSIGQGTTAWAFANWGSDFYFFTTKNETESVVTKYEPAKHRFSHVTTAPGRIVGSGVSTCAPL